MTLPRVVAYFDGLCEPAYKGGRRNPGGVGCWGVVVYRDERVVHEAYGMASEPGPESTNNVAEYAAATRALEWLLANAQNEAAVLRGDSQLVIRQLQGQWRVESPRVEPLYAAADAVLKELPLTRLEWVPRAQNEHADALSNRAYQEALAANPHWSRAKDAPASPKQRAFLESLGVDAPEGLTKRDASKLIERTLDAKQQRLSP